jgi:hypothetical protein
MDVSSTSAKFSYRLQAKPEGGFVAIPSDPAMETVEGATKEEVEQKISEIIAAPLPTTLKVGGINTSVRRKVNLAPRSESGSATGVDAPKGDLLNQNSAPIVPADYSRKMLGVIAAAIVVQVLIYYFFFVHR